MMAYYHANPERYEKTNLLIKAANDKNFFAGIDFSAFEALRSPLVSLVVLKCQTDTKSKPGFACDFLLFGRFEDFKPFSAWPCSIRSWTATASLILFFLHRLLRVRAVINTPHEIDASFILTTNLFIFLFYYFDTIPEGLVRLSGYVLNVMLKGYFCICRVSTKVLLP
ncbi:hypothetical protein AVEN_103383-1, partial [Araneus ventricosus]